MSEHVVSDFKGKDDLLIQSIDSLLAMDAKGILVPHGIGGHARTLLRAAKAAIEQAARTVPEGWRIDRCSDGSINVIKDGHCGANVEQNAEQARRIPEEVLWMLANDMLSAAPEGKK